MGSPRFETVETGNFRLTKAWFPPGAVLEPHTHEGSIVAFMLSGGFRTRIGSSDLACNEGTGWTEPLGEQHSNFVGDRGAHCLVIQADHGNKNVEVFSKLLSEVHLIRDPFVNRGAARVAFEFNVADDVTKICIEAESMLLLAGALRGRQWQETKRPHWLDRAIEMLHAEWREFPGLSDVARAVDVHPCSLAHAFRAHSGQSLGKYLRALQLNWALNELMETDHPISQIAHEAGYSDQSHLTRRCKRETGLTPGELRSPAGHRSKVKFPVSPSL